MKWIDETGPQGEQSSSQRVRFGGFLEQDSIRNTLFAAVVAPLAALAIVLGFLIAPNVGSVREAGQVSDAAENFIALSRLRTALELEKVDSIELVSIATSDFAASNLLVDRIDPADETELQARFEQSVRRTDAALSDASSSGQITGELRERQAQLEAIRDRTVELTVTPAEIDLFYSRFAEAAGTTKAQPKAVLTGASNPEVRVAVAKQQALADAAVSTAALRSDLSMAVGFLASSVRLEWDALRDSTNTAFLTTSLVEPGDAGRERWDAEISALHSSFNPIIAWTASPPSVSGEEIDVAIANLVEAREASYDTTIVAAELLEMSLEDIEVLTEQDRRHSWSRVVLSVAALMVTLTVAVLVAIRLSKSIITPLEHVAGVARRVGEGNLDVGLVKSDGPAEVAEVSVALNSLVTSLDLIKQQAGAFSRGEPDSPAFERKIPGDLGRSLDSSIGEWRRATAAAQQANAVTTAIDEAASEALLRCDADWRILSANPAAASMFGRSRSRLRGDLLTNLVEPEEGTLEEAFSRSNRFSGPAVAHAVDGEIKTAVVATRVSTGNEVVHAVSIRDASERQELLDRLNTFVRQDRLTGLASRHRLFELLSSRLDDGAVGVVVIAVDRFKATNDLHGEDIGDQVLAEMADRLRKVVRGDDIVARTGGDEFVIVPSIAGSSPDSGLGLHQLTKRAELFLAEIERPYRIDGLGVCLTASVGVAVSNNEADAQRVVQDATLAVQEAKSRGGGHVLAYDTELKNEFAQRVVIRNELEEAIAQNELELWYQPVVAASGGELVGVEALVRWPKPDGTMTMPGDFIPVAEESDLIVRLDEWVIDQACRQLSEWSDGPLSNAHIAVNISGRHFVDGDLAATILASTTRWAIDPHRLAIEVTESYLADDTADVRDTLDRVHKLGARLLIDDFGTGYSSLAYLQDLPFDVLKIDRAFVNRMGQSTASRAIVQALISLAKTLDLTVLAEGIETADQAIELAKMGVDQLQGFHIARPMPPTPLNSGFAAESLNHFEFLTDP